MGRKSFIFSVFCVCALVSALSAVPVLASKTKAKAKAGSRIPVPTGLEATLSYPEILLTWNAVTQPGTIGYIVYRGLSAKKDFVQLNASPTPSTSYADSPGVVNRTYYYKVAAVTGTRTGSASSPVSIYFYDNVPPVISNIGSGSITGSGAVIVWTTDEPADSQVDYGLSASYGESTPPDSTLVTSHSVILSGLSGNSFYHFRVRSADAQGNAAVSADYTFRTLDLIPPVISDLKPGPVGADQAVVSWITDKPATTELEYAICGDTAAALSQPDYVTTHAIAISNLAPGALYCYRAISRNAAGAVATSPTRSFRTAGGDLSACLSCHGDISTGAPLTGDFATDGHGKTDINLICLDCHNDHQTNPAGYKYLSSVNGYSYTDPDPDWAGAVATQKNFCNLACHSVAFFGEPGGPTTHPVADVTGDPLNPYARACLGFAVLPGPEFPLLDADLTGTQTCDDIIMCVTCHTPHGKAGSIFMLRTGSEFDLSPLCFSCHQF